MNSLLINILFEYIKENMFEVKNIHLVKSQRGSTQLCYRFKRMQFINRRMIRNFVTNFDFVM